MDDAKASEVAILNKSLYRKVEKPKNIQVGFVEDIYTCNQLTIIPCMFHSCFVSLAV